MDESCHALNELILPEGYVTTIHRQQGVGNLKEYEIKVVNFKCSWIDRRSYSAKDFSLAPLRHRIGSSCATEYSSLATTTLLQRHNARSFLQVAQVQATPEAPPAV